MITTRKGTKVETFREKEILHKEKLREEGKIGAHSDFMRHRKHHIPSWRWRGKYRSLRNITRKRLKLATKREETRRKNNDL